MRVFPRIPLFLQYPGTILASFKLCLITDDRRIMTFFKNPKFCTIMATCWLIFEDSGRVCYLFFSLLLFSFHFLFNFFIFHFIFFFIFHFIFFIFIFICLFCVERESVLSNYVRWSRVTLLLFMLLCCHNVNHFILLISPANNNQFPGQSIFTWTSILH